MRKVLTSFVKVQQGTIFSNAKCLLNYDKAYGVVINGSCDIDNEHYQNLLYLPIISFADWQRNALISKLLKEKKSEIEKKFLEKVEKTNLSFESLFLLDNHVKEIVEKYYKKKNDQELLYKYYILLKFYYLVSKQAEISNELMEELVLLYEKDCNAIKNRLIENKFEDYLYLENVDFSEQESGLGNGYVVLLTEVYSIPMNLRREIFNGIDLDKKTELKQYFGKEDIVLPISNLNPLYTGYLIQCFKNLFRIGIDRADRTF